MIGTYIFDFKDNLLSVGRAGSHEPLECIPWPSFDYMNYKLIDALYYKLLNIFRTVLMESPDEKHVIIVEDVLCPIPIKRIYCEVFLERLNCLKITFLPSAILECVASGSNCGLVIEIYPERTVLTPCYDNRIVESGIIESLGSIHKKMVLGDSNKNIQENRNIIPFCTPDQGLFDIDELPLNLLISRVLRAVPIDLRTALLNNIIVSHENEIGYGQVVNKIMELGPNVRIIHSMGSWVGASIFSLSLQNQTQKTNFMISKQCYNHNDTHLPDWFENRYIFDTTLSQI